MDEIKNQTRKLTCTLNRKYNLGNYESIDIFVADSWEVDNNISNKDADELLSNRMNELGELVDVKISKNEETAN